LACVAGKLPPEEAIKGKSNDGYEIKGEYHAAIIAGLRDALVHKRKYAKFLKKQEKTMLSIQMKIERLILGRVKEKRCLYPFSWENVKEFLEFCENNKGFRVY
jgi:hypothetical protein